jgi:hypothetical protein
MKLKEIFKNELNQINNKEFRAHIVNILDTCSNYIIKCPSSSSGKYHPEDETSQFGMIKHIKRVAVFADEVARMERYSSIERDILIAGAILHDVYKNGPTSGVVGKDGLEIPKSKHTVENHPIYIFEKIFKYVDNLKAPLGTEAKFSLTNVNEIKDFLPYTAVVLIMLAGVCLFHSGQWTIPESKTAFKNTGFKMTPEWAKLCNSMHMADYFASRRSVYNVMQKQE